MPLLLLFSTSDQSLDTVANSEVIAVEIVRTLCGSMGLVAAVPITTAMAALVVTGELHAGHDHSDVPGYLDTPTAPPPAERPETGVGEAAAGDEADEPTADEPPATGARWEDFSPEESDGL